ncbi:hypothetical protein ACFV6F_23870 [Kitasatospora phosalacinea]|uniref:NucA/NucB deoxyribonuclease domain-containing protein n=1 Tax=Kitasatospora phosalacinea TaxID=2065 RepID=UPI0036660589
MINYEYTDRTLITWAHQLEVTAYSGWGDAMTATVEGAASPSGSCSLSNSSFPAQPLQPTSTWRIGEAFYNSTATAIGAIGFCTTTWQLTFRAPGGYTPAGMTYARNNVRCDNATPNANPGCVVYWYAPPVFYSQTNTPDLANHVARAQASGLPGGTFDRPLTRITNPDLQEKNRQLACGDAPSITDKSCDEYPLASTKQGLYTTPGGARRTFDGCSFNLPQTTGPTGVSVCMIAASNNNSQGGTMSNFYRAERVLDNDDYRVLVIA